MQEGVAWDPVTFTHPVPWYVKLYFLYLLGALCLSFIRSNSLAKRVWFFRNRGVDELGDAGNALAEAALKGKLGHAERPTGQVDLAPADAQFTLTWQLSCNKVRGMKRVVVFTLLLSMLVTVAGAANVLYRVSMQRTTSVEVWSYAWAEVFTTLGIGLFVCALIYLAADVFEGVLERRKAGWTYFYRNAKVGSKAAPESTHA